MTQEEKSLLLRDLCGRLSYGIIMYRKMDNSTNRIPYSDITESIYQFSHFLEYSGIDGIKPYLRSMSSMTEEERTEYFLLTHRDNDRDLNHEASAIIDWLNSHHFDYHGLIKKGLALEAPKDMYK